MYIVIGQTVVPVLIDDPDHQFIIPGDQNPLRQGAETVIKAGVAPLMGAEKIAVQPYLSLVVHGVETQPPVLILYRFQRETPPVPHHAVVVVRPDILHMAQRHRLFRSRGDGGFYPFVTALGGLDLDAVFPVRFGDYRVSLCGESLAAGNIVRQEIDFPRHGGTQLHLVFPLFQIRNPQGQIHPVGGAVHVVRDIGICPLSAVEPHAQPATVLPLRRDTAGIYLHIRPDLIIGGRRQLLDRQNRAADNAGVQSNPLAARGNLVLRHCDLFNGIHIQIPLAVEADHLVPLPHRHRFAYLWLSGGRRSGGIAGCATQ